ncbi:MAG: ATP-binding protein, partial [Caulobacteraceae bacterium]
LPLRAMAYARVGDLAAARSDLQMMRSLRAMGAFPAAAFEQTPLVEAVLAHAGSRDVAFDMLMDYFTERAAKDAQGFHTGLGELMQDKALRDLRRQIDEHRRIDLIGGGLFAVVVALLLWQMRSAFQLRRARAAADAANRAKSEFLANMSHEIRTPLNGVVAVADMLARADLTPRERQMAEMIRSSGDTLERLLSDILDVARIEAGQITLEAAPFHLGDMARSAAALSQLKCEEKGVRLTAEVAPEVDRTVVGDMVRVRQVITNLLSNAVKFTEAGEVRLNVERTAGGLVRFVVADTGIGFEMADKAKILGRFQQADNSITRRYGGTGLGLTICCDLAARMGGSLECEGAPGVGSRFWMELPLAFAAAEETVAAAAEEPVLAASDGEPLKILLADDHPTNRKVVELILDGDLAVLTQVEDGAQAVQAFRAGAFDLVLMDMQMPVMDGLTAIGEIRRLERAAGVARTPIIMLTANTLPEHVNAALAAGADLHLAKPLTAGGLFEAIGAALELGAQPEAA